MSVTIQFKTADELYVPPPVKGQKKGPTWFLLLVLFVCAAGAVWMNRNGLSAHTPTTVTPVPVPTGKPEDVDTKMLKPAKERQDLSPSSSTVKTEEKVPEVIKPIPQKIEITSHESRTQQSTTTANTHSDKPVSRVGGNPQPTPVMARPITVQMCKEAGFFTLTLRVPRDARGQIFHRALLSQTKVDVLVEKAENDKKCIGRARVALWIDKSASEAQAVLEFAWTPDLATLVFLTNARLSSDSKIVIELGRYMKIEYPFSMSSGMFEADR